jgi:hypothetical protein
MDINRIAEDLDKIADEIQPQDPVIALAIDKVSDGIFGRPPIKNYATLEHLLVNEITPALTEIHNQSSAIKDSAAAHRIRTHASTALKKIHDIMRIPH